MKYSIHTLVFVTVISAIYFFANDIFAQVSSVHENKLELFSLKDVRITSGQFKEIQDKDHEYLLSLDPDRLLSWFRREAGLIPKAQPYPFWESDTSMRLGPLAGHILGFYMSSMSMMYETTEDERILERLRYVLSELKKCQDAHGDGYLLATINGRQLFEEVARGNIRTNNPTINGVWEPVYIMNKIMLGLAGVYERCGLEEAKPILAGMADWFGTSVIDKLSHENMQKLLVCEHGSINESYIDTYRITGNKKYLQWAKQLNDEDMWVPLSQKRDILPGWHANTQIPKFTGFANVYKYGGDAELYDAAEFFWNLVVDKHTWINGSNSTGEHFFPSNEFENRITQYGGPESCNSVNLMRLSEVLYRLDGSMEKVDYYERVLFNHVLANYDPEEGMCVYYTSMRPGHYRIYATKYDSFWCCVGTGLEAPAKFAKMIYAHKNDDLFVNMFIPSELSWKSKDVRLIQETDFPDKNSVKLIVRTEKETNFRLNIRKPYWVENDSLTVKIDGEEFAGSNEMDGYVSCERTWKNGDTITIEFSPKLEVSFLKESRKYASIQYGPLVMGTALDEYPLPKSEYRHERKTVADIPLSEYLTPILFGSLKEIASGIKRKNAEKLELLYEPENGPRIELIPFNRIHFSRYVMYFRYFENRNEYDRLREQMEKRSEAMKELDAMTIDLVMAGDRESEREHGMETVNSHWGDRFERKWRDARDGGYMMYNMKVTDSKPLVLYIVFMSNDFGERKFDVLIDGKVLDTIDLARESDGIKTRLFHRLVKIPPELVKGKTEAAIKLHGKRGNFAGGIWELRILCPPLNGTVPNVYQYE